MKKLFLSSLIWIGVSNTFGQSNLPGRFSLSTGFDLGVHATTAEAKIYGITIPAETDGAATKLFQFNAHYSFAKWFSAGLGFRNGSYFIDPEDSLSQYKSNKVSEFYIDTRFYFVNKDKFNMYGCLSFGRTNFIDKFDASGYNQTMFFTAGTTRIGLGFNWYFSKYVGLWFNMDFASRNFLLTRYEINGAKQDLSNFEYRLLTKGVHLALGLCFKFK